jgi:hypothetical protein
MKIKFLNKLDQLELAVETPFWVISGKRERRGC